MKAAAFCEPAKMRGSLRIDFWSVIMAVALAMIGLVLVWPIMQVLVLGFFDPETKSISFAGYVKVLTHPYYLGALWNTMLVGVGGMVGACLLGVPLAYCTARYVIKGRGLITTLAVMALVSPPFIGAYSWIIVLGNNGWLTQQMKALGVNGADDLWHVGHHSGVQPEILPVRLPDDRKRAAQHQPVI